MCLIGTGYYTSCANSVISNTEFKAVRADASIDIEEDYYQAYLLEKDLLYE